MMNVTKKEMGSECLLSFQGDEHRRAVKGKMMNSAAALGLLYCQPSCSSNSLRRGQEVVMW